MKRWHKIFELSEDAKVHAALCVASSLYLFMQDLFFARLIIHSEREVAQSSHFSHYTYAGDLKLIKCFLKLAVQQQDMASVYRRKTTF